MSGDGSSRGIGAIQVPIGSGVGQVQVVVDSPATFELTSRSTSGQVFTLSNTVQGDQVRTWAPKGRRRLPWGRTPVTRAGS